jgi:hypothetical protein
MISSFFFRLLFAFCRLSYFIFSRIVSYLVFCLSLKQVQKLRNLYYLRFVIRKQLVKAD